MPASYEQSWPSPLVARLSSLANVQEDDTGLAKDEYSARLGVVLQLARKAARISQKDAATAMKMTPVSFTRWENGSTGISAYDLARLVRLYGIDYDAALVLDPPTSKVEIRKRLDPVAKAAQRAVRRGVLRALADEDAGEPG